MGNDNVIAGNHFGDGDKELGFNYLSLLFPDGLELNPDPQTPAHPAGGTQLTFNRRRQTAGPPPAENKQRNCGVSTSPGLIDGKFFSITRPFTTLNCSSLPVAFSISSAGLQITQGMSAAAMPLPCCLLAFLFAISCKWRKRGSVFLPHGSRSHNLIHLCDKLHYEGSR